MRVTVDQITFGEYEEASLAVRRLFLAQQARLQRKSPANLIVGVLTGGALYMAVSWSAGLDPTPWMRPPGYAVILLGFPLIGMLLSATVILAAQKTRGWRGIAWRVGLAILPMAAIFSICAALIWALERAAPPALPRVPYSSRDWYGALAPQAAWFLYVILVAIRTTFATRKQLRQVWDAQPALMRGKDFDITSAGVRVDERVTERTYQWPALVRFIETPALLLVCPSDVTFEVLPKRSFSSPEDLQTVRTLFDAQISAIRQQPPAFPVLPVAQA